MKCKKHGKNKTVAREKDKIINYGKGETFTCEVNAMTEKEMATLEKKAYDVLLKRNADLTEENDELKKSLDFAVKYLEVQKTSLKQALDNVESNIEKLKRFGDSADSMNKNEDQI